ncbi:MAG: ribose 5-phosphate isomerase B [Candidatus Ratteibacteria bacterium]|jgi:ribose 5-phosphate isomerase B
MKIAIASDHAGFNLKVEIKEKLIKEGYEILDFGTDSEKRVDYPEFGLAGAKAVIAKKADCAILFCGTGLGMAIMANKVRGIRAVPCNDLFSVKLTRSHNNANVLCLGGRILGPDLAWEIVLTFLNTPFAGGRHLRRVNEIKRLEKTC